ncbi:MAG: CHASE2 domain-containing protein, partial [Nitrospirota bacterium]
MKEDKKRKVLRVFAIGILTSIIVTLASYLGYLDFIQRRALDLMVWWKEEEKPSQMVIVTIDEEAFQYLGERQPLPRKYLASLINLINKCGARVIGLDVELKVRTDKDADTSITEAITDRTVLTYAVIPSSTEGLYIPTPLFIKDPNIIKGFANTYIDSDGLIRRTPLVLKDEGGNIMHSFALAIFKRFTQNNANKRVSIDMHPEKALRINYAGHSGSFPIYPSLPLFQMEERNIKPPSDNPFKDKIVLIGATFKASRDFFLTPKGLMSGVEVQANIVHTLLTKGEVRAVSWIIGLLIQVSLSMIVGILFITFRPLKAVIISLSGIFLFFVPLSYLAYSKGNYWVDFVLPVVAVAITSIAYDYLERKKIRESFSQYVSSEVVEKIYRDESALKGQRRTVTVLFSDIRGF